MVSLSKYKHMLIMKQSWGLKKIHLYSGVFELLICIVQLNGYDVIIKEVSVFFHLIAYIADVKGLHDLISHLECLQ